MVAEFRKMDKKPINDKDLKLTEDYLSRLRRTGVTVDSAFIFGSRIKGTANYWSDLDLCIVSPRFGRDRQRERVMLLNLRENEDLMIEPHPFSPVDFQNKFDPLVREIKSTGYKIV